MSIEQAEKLKSAHRAEQARKEAEKRQQEAEEKAASDAGFAAAVAEMVRKRGVEWMAEFGSEGTVRECHIRVIDYMLPGHRPIRVEFRSMGGGAWAEACVVCTGVWPWYVDGYGFAHLAEALCKAEKQGDDEPIPF